MFDPIAANAWIVVTMVVLVGLLGFIAYEKWHGWLSAFLGVWLVISPWITGVSTHPDIVLNSVIAGTLVAVLSVSGICVANT